ncbi:V-type ATP synthase subunit I [Roseibium aquae]|uniref:V-type ATP synthase subunit I n=1 Tax=Roseibium aquae TaxID=1323746 RepID=A0A916T8U1_9HYPH|nr:V-type ATP synthase subunit I [Roseibium aquae]GGB33530.1 V-type ATP synthase subunit I [Roseibium aquae]
MSITALQKVSLIGVMDDKEAVLETLQAFGRLHLIPLTSAQKELEAVSSGRGQEAVDALRWIMACDDQRRPVKDATDFQTDQIVHQALANRTAFREAEDLRSALIKRIKEVEPWGEFSFTDLQDIGDQRLWFYIVPANKVPQIDLQHKIIEVVHQDRYRAYIVLLSPEEPPADAMPVPRAHIGSKSLSELNRELERTEILIEDLEQERQALTKWRVLLAENLASARDRSARARAALETADEERIFLLQAWAPADKQDEIEALAGEMGVAASFEDPDPGEIPPTLLHNRPELAAGESLVEFYQTPSYRDWDPSVIVYVSFVLFFGMIMTDAGYGLLLLGLLYLFKRRLTGGETSRRLFKMAVWLTISTTVFGVLTGSYFGITPSPDSLLGRFKIMDLNDVDTMMKITLTIGAAHLILANLMQSWHASGRADRLQPIGWAIVVAGGISTFLGQDTVIASLGPVAVVTGLIMVGVFASDREVTSWKTAGLRVFDGLAALARIVNVFSDVLSYMRLFALGLAAASLAETINNLAGQLQEAVPGIGLLIALLVLAVGHMINIGLGLIGGTVHGLRLNVIEFFNWSLKGEGTPFRPFKKEETGL